MYAMLKSYLTIASTNIIQYKGYSSINVISKEFLTLVLLANTIAWPVAYYAMNQWLQNFAYRTSIKFWTYLLAAGLAFLIALSYQAIKAALSNPVDSIRYE